MSQTRVFRRKNYFIKKDFQGRFSIWFACLILIEAFLIGALFMYISRGTLTTAYMYEGLRIERTGTFFLVGFILISLIVIILVGITALVVFVLLSHKIAGPLYRFEQSLNEVARGKLSHRIRLRKNDQLEELQNSLNGFIASMDDSLSGIQQSIAEIQTMAQEPKPDITRIREALSALKERAGYFATSK